MLGAVRPANSHPGIGTMTLELGGLGDRRPIPNSTAK
jgi:hypothetical protein